MHNGTELRIGEATGKGKTVESCVQEVVGRREREAELQGRERVITDFI